MTISLENIFRFTISENHCIFSNRSSEKIKIVQKSKLGLGYSKIFQLSFLVPKLYFRDLKLKMIKNT